MKRPSRNVFVFVVSCLLATTAAYAVDVVTGSLPSGMEMVPYSIQLEATNGVTPYTWKDVSGQCAERLTTSTFAETGGPMGVHTYFDIYPVDLPFAFPFYGEAYTRLYVSSRGRIAFEPTDWLWQTEATLINNRMIAVLWRTIHIIDPGEDIFVETSSTNATIRWKGNYSGFVINTSVALDSSGRITMRYGEGNPEGVVGVSNGDGAHYTVGRHSNAGTLSRVEDAVFTPQPGAIPAGLALSQDGLLHGIPQTACTNVVSVQVEDWVQARHCRTLPLSIQANPNRPPVIHGTTPPAGPYVLAEQTNATFFLDASDPEGSNLLYRWYLDDGLIVAGTPAVSTNTVWGDAGRYRLSAQVSDGLWSNVWAHWNVFVTPDNDADGIPNQVERDHPLLDPWVQADATNDNDGDFLWNIREIQAGTCLTNADTDADSLTDGWEVRYRQDPLSPTGAQAGIAFSVTGAWDQAGLAYDVDLHGNYALLASGVDGLRILDVSNPAQPVLIRSVNTPEEAFRVVARDGVAYVADATALVTVDISTPSNAAFLGSCPTPGNARDVAVQGDYAYVASAGSGIHVIDISSSSNMHLVATVDTDGHARSLALDGSRLFVADKWNGLVCYDIIGGTNLHVLGTYRHHYGDAWGVCVQDDRAYVTWTYEDFTVLDVSTPTNMLLLGSCDASWANRDVVVTGQTVFLCDDDLGVAAVDVSDALHPQLIGELGHGRGFGLATRGGLVYAALQYDGLAVLHTRAVDGDGDGLDDAWEQRHWQTLSYSGTNDVDGDGITERGEYLAGFDPREDDQDGDGLVDGTEVWVHNTRPDNSDSDRDGIRDSEEVVPGADGDVTDPTNTDTDGDRSHDGRERPLGRDPTTPEPSYALLFSDDMEAGPGKWVADPPWELSSDDYASPFTAWSDSPWTNYQPSEAEAYLVLAQPVDLSPYRHAWLEFRQRIDTDWDTFATVEISTDGGQSWEELDDYSGWILKQWDLFRFGISSYCGNSQVLIRFGLITSEWSESRDGWHIDDVAIYASDSDISGTVTSEEGPVEGAQVRLVPAAPGGEPYAETAWTSSDGGFLFEMPIPGHYLLKADAERFAAQYYREAEHRSNATPIALPLGLHTNADFMLGYGTAACGIIVTSAPVSAEVWLDFENTGLNTPVLLEDVEPGSHFVWVRRPPYPTPVPVLIGVEEGETTTVAFDLETAPGSLRVESAPEDGATVYLDFQPTGMVTPCILTNLSTEVPAGSHAAARHFVSIEKPGFPAPAPRSGTVEPGSTNTVVFTLPVPAEGMLFVTSSPTGAVVWLDYRDTGQRSDALLSGVPVGSHFVRATLPGFHQPAVQGIGVTSGRTSRAHFTFRVHDLLDGDSDGLPDAWERAVGLNSTPGPGGEGSEGGNGDWDRDGRTNAQELRAGTSPVDAESVLALSECDRTVGPADPFTITWRSVPGKYYRVDCRGALSTGTWERVSGAIRATDATTGYSDYTTRLQCLYRVVVLP